MYTAAKVPPTCSNDGRAHFSEKSAAVAFENWNAFCFEVGDVLRLADLGLTFDTIMDSGVFHVFDDDQRPTYVKSLRSALRPGGTCYLMCFSDRQPGDWGPRRVSEAELRSAFAEGWTIEPIEPAEFAVAIEPDRVQAWLATIHRQPD